MDDKQRREFDPSQHLSSVKGQEYLEVKWRLAWIRSVYPEARIVTDLLQIENDRAIVRAEVTAIDGGEIKGVATGIGSETATGFGNFIEKAETKAIGRALAALGFGTQFADDFADDTISGEGIADAPVQRPRQQARQTFRQQGQQRPVTPGAATEKQVAALYGIAKSMGWSKDDLIRFLGDTMPEALNSEGASAAIKDLNAMKAENGG